MAYGGPPTGRRSLRLNDDPEEGIERRTRAKTNLGNQLITWNMEGQGGGSGVKLTRLRGYLDDKCVRVICLQECGNPADLPEVPGWTLVPYPWGIANPASRCSMATYVRGATIADTRRQAGQDRHRGILGVTISFEGRSIDIWNVHAPSAMNANTAAAIEDTIAIAARNPRPFVILGDHNQFPDMTEQGALAIEHELEVCATTIATRPSSGRIYDYFTFHPDVDVHTPTILNFDSDHTTVAATVEFEKK